MITPDHPGNESTSEFPVAPPLPADRLHQAQQLPLKPNPVKLSGTRVTLIPLDIAQHSAPLFAVSNGSPIQMGDRTFPAYDADALIWRYMPYGPFADLAAFEAYLTDLAARPDLRAFCVLTPDQQPIGVMTLMSNAPTYLRIELGHIWLSPIAQGTRAITEASYLLMRHCFDLGYRRVEWKCDALNARSRRTALSLGFTFEMIQQKHLIVKQRNRDTAWFRILDHEWPDVRRNLEAKLSTG